MFSFRKKKFLQLKKVMKGDIISIIEVPDLVFSQKMLGDGYAVKPINGEVRAPVAGKIVSIFPTNHAFGILTEEGIEVLVHIGIDTVELKGEGFMRVKEVGDIVNPGDIVIKVDLELVATKGKSTITPVIITNMDKIKNISINQEQTHDYAAKAELI